MKICEGPKCPRTEASAASLFERILRILLGAANKSPPGPDNVLRRFTGLRALRRRINGLRD